MSLTLGASRPVLWRYVSNVSYESAQDSDIQQFDATLNRLCQTLLSGNKFRTCYRRVTLRTYNNKLTLARNLSTCLGCDPVPSPTSWCVGFPLQMYTRWFEFAAQGPGLTSDSSRACSIRGLIPVSDTAQTFADPVMGSTWKLRVKSTSGNGRGMTFVGGLDENGDIIEGNVKLEVTNGTTTTSQEYTEMPFIEKAGTPASVEIYSVDTTSSEETLLCVYAPSETVPAYKRYVIPSAGDGNTFACLCKLAFVPAINDTDLIIPSIIDALAKGLQSIQFSDRNDAERAGLYFGPNFAGSGDSQVKTGVMAGCVDILDAELSEDEAAELPTFQMSEGYGCSTIPNLDFYYGNMW